MERRWSEKRELCLRISYCNRTGGGIVGSFLVSIVAAAVVESLATLFSWICIGGKELQDVSNASRRPIVALPLTLKNGGQAR